MGVPPVRHAWGDMQDEEMKRTAEQEWGEEGPRKRIFAATHTEHEESAPLDMLKYGPSFSKDGSDEVNRFFDDQINSEELRSSFDNYSLYYGSLDTGRDNCEVDLIYFIRHCLDHQLRLHMRDKYHYETMLVGDCKAFQTNLAQDVQYDFLLCFVDKLHPKDSVHSSCVLLLEKAEMSVISTLKHLYGATKVVNASLDNHMRIRECMREFFVSPLLKHCVTHIFTELLLQESQSSVHNMIAADLHFPVSNPTMFNMEATKMKYKMGRRALILEDLDVAFGEGKLEANGALDYLISIGLALVNGFLYKKMPRGIQYSFGALSAVVESEKSNQVEKCNLMQLKAQFPKSTCPSIAMSGFQTMSIKDRNS